MYFHQVWVLVSSFFFSSSPFFVRVRLEIGVSARQVRFQLRHGVQEVVSGRVDAGVQFWIVQVHGSPGFTWTKGQCTRLPWFPVVPKAVGQFLVDIREVLHQLVATRFPFAGTLLGLDASAFHLKYLLV